MATPSSALAWKIPWVEEPGRLQSMGCEETDTTERLHFHFSLSCVGEGNGNPLQCSCLENPRDGGAWWAAVYGVSQSRTWLKRLSSSNKCHTWVLEEEKQRCISEVPLGRVHLSLDVSHYNMTFPQLLGAKTSAGSQYLRIFRKNNSGFSPIPV